MPSYSGVWSLSSVYGAAAAGLWPGNQHRIVYAGGATPDINVIEYVNINSEGNAVDFGDLHRSKYLAAACSSITRGVFNGGTNNPGTTDNVIEYITFATTGNAVDFGDTSQTYYGRGAGGDDTRGIFAGGQGGTTGRAVNIDYITFATAGNATNFGNLSTGCRQLNNSQCSSPSRSVFHLGNLAAGNSNILEYITTATTGNSVDFGDLFRTCENSTCFSNGIRGYFMGGNTGFGGGLPRVDYITFATTGNTVFFGDLDSTFGNNDVSYGAGASSRTKGVFAYGRRQSSQTTAMRSTILSTIGAYQDFGNLTSNREYHTACSNAHGGL